MYQRVLNIDKVEFAVGCRFEFHFNSPSNTQKNEEILSAYMQTSHPFMYVADSEDHPLVSQNFFSAFGKTEEMKSC